MRGISEPQPDARGTPLADTAVLLLSAARSRAIVLSGDLRVNEKDAASLLGYSGEYLKKMRQEGKSPPFFLRGVGGGRISYRITDMAQWIDERQESG